MPRRPKPGTRPVAGIVLVDKPSGLTSNRLLQQIRRLFCAQKAGHTGTLDPLATGMLPICLGAATRVSGLMLDASKRYRVTARFGMATDTGDSTGQEIARNDTPAPSAAAVATAVAALTGPIHQVPPMFSAIRHEGRRLYELAREGREVERKSRAVEIHELVVERFAWPELTLEVHCSKGTYVRTLVTDLAESLGSLAHVTALRRLSVGPYPESAMVSPEALELAAAEGLDCLDRYLLGIDSALEDHPAVTVSAADGEALRQGRRVQLGPGPGGEPVRIYTADGGFVGLGRLAPSGELRPERIFPPETLVTRGLFG